MTTPPPGYPIPAQQPAGAPYPMPPRKRKVWPWVLLAVFLAFVALVGGCVALFSTTANEVAKSEERRTSAAPAGSPVRDGQFEFVVTGTERTPTVGDGYLTETAQGEYLLVYVDITNTGGEPRSYFGENQKAIDDQGREFTNDTMAELAIDSGPKELNPGLTISKTIIFDIPVGSRITAIEFHDSALSGGARVALE
ncbi:DUF4352 domain-containing protein [Nocardia otitidiscaviarum]|uniref:DUF4352 domain-containing protein n=1 Tax=Nocardia otitidiscaviarum TaxID=1823 RepID=UPI0005BDBC1C|nr:DUF4352 domain-containing protein [Nocardia otitidiscaviarum]